MFDNLNDKLGAAMKVLSGNNKITELNVSTAIKDIRRALVDADVNFKIAKEFTDKVKERALGTDNVLKNIKPGELMIKIVKDELTTLMGGQSAGINLKGAPSVILISGLQGSGKTTFTGKLALYLKTQKQKRPLVVACDVYRPAAVDQLTVLAEKVGVPIYKEPENKNPVQIALNAIVEAKRLNYDVVIVDTAGRLAIDEAMMIEILNIKKAINPNETLFVVDAMTGQDAVNTAKAFNDTLNFDGVVLTKLDGDTRGGAALSIKYTVGKPIKFVSEGEKLETLDIFYPERMSDRILGMGDITTLVERAQAQFDEAEMKKLEAKMKRNAFDYNDFFSQIQSIKKMGDMKSLISMIPGASKALKDVDLDSANFKRVECVIQSMTLEERKKPELMNIGRKKRIARGCGQSLEEINAFVKQFEDMRKMMHMMSNNKMPMQPPTNMPRGRR